jgi:uncharacterized beta-barrel protein YwiB (DUF1934 family)
MTRDVLVSISGLQTELAAGIEMEDAGEDEPIEVVTPAQYFCKNGKHYILYDEVSEGISGTTKNKIKITGDECMEVMKSGVTNSHMIFEKNKKNFTYYQTPFGQMLVGIRTKNMEVNVSEKNIDVSVDYELDVNHEPLADCEIKLNIMENG